MERLNDNLEDELLRLVSAANAHGITFRVLGGMAIKVHSPAANHRSLEREYPDIDFMTDRRGGRKLGRFLPAMGYIPNKALNILNGDRRQMYYDSSRLWHIDIFVEHFEMCHRLPMTKRLHLEPLTVPLAELFLSKAQIVELNYKDVLDLFALLLDHPVGNGDDETINIQPIARLCARDWGLYTTVSITLQKLRNFLLRESVDLKDAERQVIRERLSAIQRAIDGVPKTFAWKARSKVGKRMRWYGEVEEMQR